MLSEEYKDITEKLFFENGINTIIEIFTMLAELDPTDHKSITNYCYFI